MKTEKDELELYTAVTSAYEIKRDLFDKAVRVLRGVRALEADMDEDFTKTAGDKAVAEIREQLEQSRLIRDDAAADLAKAEQELREFIKARVEAGIWTEVPAGTSRLLSKTRAYKWNNITVRVGEKPGAVYFEVDAAE